MRIALQAKTPDKSIDVILEYMGKALKGERTYIFEKNKSGGDDNTYEWVASGVTPQIENLQNLPPNICENWYKYFNQRKKVTIDDLEKIKDTDVLLYDLLKQQDIHSIVVVPLLNDTEPIGFYGVDNPQGESLDYIENMLHIVGHFIVSCLKRRDLLIQLEQMSYNDQLTNLGNRFAVEKFVQELQKGESLGVVFCDITGLKKVNDTKGHKAGDKLIINASESLKEVFGEYGLFRMGGDELLAICPGISREELILREKELRRISAEKNVIMAIGAVWHKNSEADMDKLLKRAEKLMYEDKSAYYMKAGIDRREV